MVAPAARAQSIFAGTPLATNSVARYFEPLPAATYVPDIMLHGDGGSRHHLSELTGKNRLVAIWAEWCAPCLIEAGDLARLYARYGGPHFEVVSVLSDSRQRLDVKGARDVLARTHAQALPLWVEAGGGSVVATALAGARGSAIDLPCTLLVDHAGAVKGRMTGLAVVPNGGSIWATPDADLFIQALSRDTRPGNTGSI
jgi:thiol-disulfide isomerase/thioredoxin